MNKPLISVIIPAYNRATLIGETIECMLGQTLPPHEVIVVDDGSTDDTVAVVRSFSNRVTLIQQANSGPGAARNAGFARATGEFIQFFDSDDLATRDKLELQARALIETKADIAYSSWTRAWFSEDKVRIENNIYQQRPVPIAPFSAYMRGWILFIPACLIRRDLLERVGCYPTGLRTGEDMEMLMRIILAAARFAHAPGPVLLYRQHPESQISFAPEIEGMRARERLQLLVKVERLIADARLRPSLVDRLYWQSFMWEARNWCNHAEGVDPESIGIEALFVRSRQVAAGLRARLGGTRLGRLFAPGPLTTAQSERIDELGYDRVVA